VALIGIVPFVENHTTKRLFGEISALTTIKRSHYCTFGKENAICFIDTLGLCLELYCGRFPNGGRPFKCHTAGGWENKFALMAKKSYFCEMTVSSRFWTQSHLDMKKILLAAAAALLSANAFAQVSIGAGYVNTALRVRNGDDSPTVTSMQGAYVGVGYGIDLGEGFTLEPGVYYSFGYNGESVSLKDEALYAKGKLWEHYLTVPVYFRYGIEVSPNVLFLIYGGPSYCLGLSSKSEFESSVPLLVTTIGTDDSIDNYGDGSVYSRHDMKLGGGIGVEVAKRVRATVGVDAGVLNRYTGDSDYKTHTNFVHFGVAYLFQ